MATTKTSVAETARAMYEEASKQAAILYTRLPPSLQETLDRIQTQVSESPYMTRSNLQFGMRIVVVLLTFLLFRPHLETLYRKLTNNPDPRTVELQNRLRFLQDLKEGKIAPQGGVQVVDGKVVLKPHPPPTAQGIQNAKSGKGKVVKLMVPGDESPSDSGAQTSATTATPTPAKSRRRKA
ncbi:hypothetical protein B0A52_08134 [Exophiala mesophila]|uniref:Uncharacterized protein n=1 Tax=Exophiala mesophila TaxID=212818 RepID=A0A438MV67_EXOME|nr:hypothetical protein B0A52_08134 [Exophiala mesophila]